MKSLLRILTLTMICASLVACSSPAESEAPVTSTPAESESSSEPSSSVAPPPISSSKPPASSSTPPASSSTPPAPVYFNTSDLNVFNQESIDARIFEGVMVHLNEDDLIEDFVAELKNIFKSLEIITLNETQKAKYNSTEPWVYGADIITSDLSSIIYLYDDFAAFKHADTVQFIKFPSGKMGELETIIGRYATAVHNRDEIKNNPDNPDIMTGGENQNESEDSSEQVDVTIGGTNG